MEAKLKITLNSKESRGLMGALAEQRTQAAERDAMPRAKASGLRAIAAKLRKMPKGER